MRVRLIPEARRAWRMLSVNLSALGAITCGAWLMTPPDAQAQILAVLGIEPGVIPLLGFLTVIVGRLIDQPKVRGENDPPDPPSGGMPLAALAALALVAGLAVAPRDAAASCAPAPKGGGSAPTWGLNAVGAWVNWWCVDQYAVEQQLFVVRWDSVTPALRADLSAISDAPDMAAAISETRAKHWTVPISDPRLLDVWGPDDEKIWSTRPAGPVWTVRPNPQAADLSRPMYLLVNGNEVGSQDYRRAKAGDFCACSVRALKGGNTYCAIPPSTTSVTICDRQP